MMVMPTAVMTTVMFLIMIMLLVMMMTKLVPRAALSHTQFPSVCAFVPSLPVQVLAQGMEASLQLW